MKQKIKKPKKKKLISVRNVVIFILIYSLGKMLGGSFGKEMATQENPNILMGDELRKVYRRSHIESCMSNGSTEKICSCTYDGLIERFGLDGYGEMAAILVEYVEEGKESPEATEYMEIMLDEILKCRQKN